MSKLKKYVRKYRKFTQLNPKDQESPRGDDLWADVLELRKRLTPEELSRADDALEELV